MGCARTRRGTCGLGWRAQSPATRHPAPPTCRPLPCATLASRPLPPCAPRPPEPRRPPRRPPPCAPPASPDQGPCKRRAAPRHATAAMTALGHSAVPRRRCDHPALRGMALLPQMPPAQRPPRHSPGHPDLEHVVERQLHGRLGGNLEHVGAVALEEGPPVACRKASAARTCTSLRRAEAGMLPSLLLLFQRTAPQPPSPRPGQRRPLIAAPCLTCKGQVLPTGTKRLRALPSPASVDPLVLSAARTPSDVMRSMPCRSVMPRLVSSWTCSRTHDANRAAITSGGTT